MDKKIFKKVLNVLSSIISYICLVVLFLIAAFLLFYVLNQAIAKKNKTQPKLSLFTIVSQSMEPNINVYDVIVDINVPESKLKKGDVITFYSDSIDTGGYTVTHRIESIENIDGHLYYTTKGDNNASIDSGVITYDNIVGKVHYIIPGLGKIQFFISSKLGWFLIILIPAMGIIIIDIIKLKKVMKIKKELEAVPTIKKMDEFREKEEDKKTMALIEKANRINKK